MSGSTRALLFTLTIATSNAFAESPRPLKELKYDDGKLDRVRWCNWLAFSPDGKWLAARYNVGDRTDRIQVWPTSTWKSYSWEVKCREAIRAPSSQDCAFGRDSDCLYYAANSRLYTQRLPPTKDPVVVQPFTFDWNDYTTFSVRVLSDRDSLGVLCHDSSAKLRFDLLSPSDGKSLRDPFMVRSEGLMKAFAVSSDGSLIAIGADENDNADHVLELWETKTSKRRFRCNVPQGPFDAATFDAKGRLLASGSRDGNLRIWDTSTGRITAAVSEDRTPAHLDFHPSQRLLAYVTSEKKLANCKIINADTGKMLGSWHVGSLGASVVRFSSDGSRLATAGSDMTIRVWDIKDVLPAK